jgi:hypothetical protein
MVLFESQKVGVVSVVREYSLGLIGTNNNYKIL